MIRKHRLFPILYMFCGTAVLGSLVIGLTTVTSGRVQANQKLNFEKAVLSVMPDVNEMSLNRRNMHQIFTDLVNEPDDSSRGAYTIKRNGQIVAYAVLVSGQGFWAPIKGVIGIRPDRRTITGIAFYEQNETPGLGAEITKPGFRRQFQGKVVAATGVPLDIRRPGEQLGPSEVHAVTGATQTSTRLEVLINDALKQWRDGNEGEGGNR